MSMKNESVEMFSDAMERQSSWMI